GGDGEAVRALREADVIVLGPGDLYTSIVPNLLVEGVREAIADSNAVVIYVANLMTKPNETPGYTVRDFASTVDLYLGQPRINVVLYHSRKLPRVMQDIYAASQSYPVELGDISSWRSDVRFVGRNVAMHEPFVRHDARLLAAALRASIEGR